MAVVVNVYNFSLPTPLPLQSNFNFDEFTLATVYPDAATNDTYFEEMYNRYTSYLLQQHRINPVPLYSAQPMPIPDLLNLKQQGLNSFSVCYVDPYPQRNYTLRHTSISLTQTLSFIIAAAIQLAGLKDYIQQLRDNDLISMTNFFSFDNGVPPDLDLMKV